MAHRIRELRPEDHDDLIRLWEAAELDHRPRGRDRREGIERELAQPTSVFLVWEEDGRLIGAVLGTHDGRKGWVNRLAVLPDRRREGIGEALVRAAETRFESLGIGIVACLIEDWNGDSVRFFESIGYVEHAECIYFTKRKGPDV
jgi:ribosomal protein S18 acetylase RimI-like enzyme